MSRLFAILKTSSSSAQILRNCSRSTTVLRQFSLIASRGGEPGLRVAGWPAEHVLPLSVVPVAVKSSGQDTVVTTRLFSTFATSSKNEVQMKLNELCHAGDLSAIQTLLRNNRDKIDVNWQDDSLR